jgi:hypothetical protein
MSVEVMIGPLCTQYGKEPLLYVWLILWLVKSNLGLRGNVIV